MWSIAIYLCFLGCANTQAASFDIRGIISGNRMASVPLGQSLGDGELDVEGICSAPGMACQNCTHAVMCVSLPYGWLKVPLEECTEGLTCNAHEGKCSATTVPECDAASQEYTHMCEQVGIFPDAYDCRKFHLCSPPEDLPDGRPADHRTALCPRHYGYNPQSAQCSIRLKKGQCNDRPVPHCSSVGQTGVLLSSPNHYYVCLMKHGELYPQIFVCPHGWYFWGGFCRPEPKIEIIETSTKKIISTKEAAESTESNSSEERVTTTKIEGFFSTEKSTTYAPDTFLADKFDLANYESMDYVAPSFDEFANSFESNY